MEVLQLKKRKIRKGEKKMLAITEAKVTPRKPRVKRSNLISSMTTEDFKMMNENSKNVNGLSNLTYKQLYSEEN